MEGQHHVEQHVLNDSVTAIIGLTMKKHVQGLWTRLLGLS